MLTKVVIHTNLSQATVGEIVDVSASFDVRRDITSIELG